MNVSPSSAPDLDIPDLEIAGDSPAATVRSRDADGREIAEITLGLLTAVEANSALTQRSIARDLGIALGLANAYLKRAARKGLIKVNDAPANRYAYYLTPKGFAEKSRLTAEYFTGSLTFFRRARRQCEIEVEACRTAGWQRLALAGAGDFAEIATLCADAHGLDVVGVIDERFEAGRAKRRLGRLPVVDHAGELDPFDAVIVTDYLEAQAVFDRLSTTIGAERIRTPRLLNVSRQPPTLFE